MKAGDIAVKEASNGKAKKKGTKSAKKTKSGKKSKGEKAPKKTKKEPKPDDDEDDKQGWLFINRGELATTVGGLSLSS